MLASAHAPIAISSPNSAWPPSVKPRSAISFVSNFGSPNHIAKPAPSNSAPSTAENPNAIRFAHSLRTMPGSSGPSARHIIGSAGRM